MSKTFLDIAHDYAREKHGNTLDDEGKNYFEAHTCQVVAILRIVTDDDALLAAAYLHDVIEDCGVTYEEIVEKFGMGVADLVMEVTHDGKKDWYGYFFPRLKSQAGIMLKFADRLSNLSRMNAWSDARRAQYLRRSVFWKNGDDRAEVLPKIVKKPQKISLRCRLFGHNYKLNSTFTNTFNCTRCGHYSHPKTIYGFRVFESNNGGKNGK